MAPRSFPCCGAPPADPPHPAPRGPQEARSSLIEALDARRGKKLLVVDRRLSPLLNRIVEPQLLREHGVEGIQLLAAPGSPEAPTEPQPVPDSCGHVVFVLRPDVRVMPDVIAWAQRVRADRPGADLSALFVPQRSLACDAALADAGLSGDVGSFELDVLMIPVERDVVSLELPDSVREVHLGGDTGSLYTAARALLRLQQRYGGGGSVLAVGRAAAATCGILAKMRHGLQASELPRPAGRLGPVVVFDRAVDFVTPLLTQMTYEGLIDEILGIRNGAVELDDPSGAGAGAGERAAGAGAGPSGSPGPAPAAPGAPPGRQRIPLGPSDAVFREIRDLSYAAAAAWLRERASTMQQDYRNIDSHSQSIGTVRAFVRRLHALPELQRHTTLGEALSQRAAQDAFQSRIRAEQSLLEGGSRAVEVAAETLEGMMVDRAPLSTVLRLLCLATHAPGGVPKRPWDGLSRALLHSYGHEHCLTLQDLRQAGVARPKDGRKSPFTVLKKPLGLLVDSLDELSPVDAAYTFGGFAPVSARVVERWVQGTLPEDALRQAAGVCFEMELSVGPNGLPAEARRESLRGRGPWSSGEGPACGAPAGDVMAVVFLGGVAPAEVSALRWLRESGKLPGELIVLTTKVMNGDGLVESLVPPVARRADAHREKVLGKWRGQ